MLTNILYSAPTLEAVEIFRFRNNILTNFSVRYNSIADMYYLIIINRP